VGQKIRQIRKSRHLTQADLASRIGVTQSDLSRMENGEYKVGLDTLFRILQVFELSMSNFFEEPAAESAESAGEVPAEDVKPGTDVPFEDWAALSDESRREVREFIAFKKMQADKTRSDGGDGNDRND
jgi:transcriptional regulator with XRE-family HTH domain